MKYHYDYFILIIGARQNLKLTLESLNPTEIAEQLVLVEFDIFCSIAPVEFTNQNWCNSDKEKLSPNILRLIQQFNSISNWVASEILKAQKSKDRALLLNRFIILAEVSPRKVKNIQKLTFK